MIPGVIGIIGALFLFYSLRISSSGKGVAVKIINNRL
jgi:hypothetical protein